MAPRGDGRTLTGESFDGLHCPVLVGAVHEGIAGFDQELAAVGDLVLRKHFLQVGGSHALVEVADVKLVHGGGLRAGRGPQQGRAGGRARAASLLGREAGRRAAGGGSRKLSLHPTPKLSGARGAEGGQRTRRGRRGVRGGPGEVPSASREADDAAQLVPSVRNPSERAGVSRFSAAALAPPLNKIDLEKKKNGAGVGGEAKPRGESPHPP